MVDSRATSDNELPDLPADVEWIKGRINPSCMAY